MSCYTRHLGDVFFEAGIEDNWENRKLADKHIREIVGKVDEDCPDVWREVKAWLKDIEKRRRLVECLREKMQEVAITS
ncbi:MAG: hypothetical protein WBW48_22885 [Anaerolineae bacterium]